MKRVYDFSKYGSIEVFVSPYVGEERIVFRGARKNLSPVGVSLHVSVWNLLDGTISGNCEPDEIEEIHLSEKNKAVLESYIARGKKIRQ